MIFPGLHPTCNGIARPRSGEILVMIAALLFGFLSALAGGQERPSRPPKTAPIYFDSLRVAQEAQYDSATAIMAFDRLLCLMSRTDSLFGTKLAEQLSDSAEILVAHRHTRAERAASGRWTLSYYRIGNAEHCRQVDARWYSFLAKRRDGRP